MPSHYKWLFLLLILAFGVRMSGWQSDDAKRAYMFFEPDEHQHLQIAQLQLSELNHDLYAPEEVPKKHFNARAYGNQIGLWLWLTTDAHEAPSNAQIVMAGRQLSTIYAVTLAGVIFLLCQMLFGTTVAIFGTFLFAINDLNITYSQYAVPESAYVFWLYFFVASVFLYFKRLDFAAMLLLLIGAAGVLAIKFDFLPAVLAIGVLVWPKVSHQHPLLFRLIAGILFGFLFFQIHCVFNLNFEELSYSFKELRSQNQNAIPEDNHWLHNPILYFLGSIAAVGLPVFLIAAFGGWRWKKQWSSLSLPQTQTILFLAVLMTLEFGVRWSIDTPFVRRLSFFMPALCIMAAYPLAQWWQDKKYRILAISVVIYSTGFMVASQINNWQDTRTVARDFLNKNYADAKISYSPYTEALGMPGAAKNLAEANVYVMHETFYRRFGKSFTTPFKTPKCCEEVYHCFWEPSFGEFHQRLITDTDSEFALANGIYTKEYFPERWMHHALFGHFETFRGDVLIFERRRVELE